ncbi:MAG: DUF1963 domain-containing protein [Muribaculaceae bacterium]|nr:DUF1963 domain-containing protein [Muribaculaceae bacterium]
MKPIYLILEAPESGISQCASRFWGNPDLPENTPYPMYIDDEGDEFPYWFICQINLEELASYDPDNLLPHKGLLSFFAKIDRYMDSFAATDCISGYVSGADAVRVLYFPALDNMREVVLVDDDDNPVTPSELSIRFSTNNVENGDEHELFAPPTHREWENWDSPFEDRIILLQIDSFSGEDFELNFMDCGVLDLLISREDLKKRDFSDVRGIVLST